MLWLNNYSNTTQGQTGNFAKTWDKVLSIILTI